MQTLLDLKHTVGAAHRVKLSIAAVTLHGCTGHHTNLRIQKVKGQKVNIGEKAEV